MKKYLIFIIGVSCLFLSYAEAEDLSYRISPGDTLEITVYDEPDLNKVVRVSEEGKVLLFLVGEVKIEGLTAGRAASRIEKLFKKDYLVNPQVNVFIREYSKFFVLGEVNKEGAYELKGNFTLHDAIALSKGAKEAADLSKVRVIRKEGGIEKEFVVNLNREGRGFSLKPLDRIIVEESGKISVLGDVVKPGSYYLKQDMTLYDAIVLAGGAKENANLAKIRIERKGSNKGVGNEVDLGIGAASYLLVKGDRIFVDSYKKIFILGQVYRPGSYDFEKDLAVIEAIALAGGFTENANKNDVQVIRVENGQKKSTKVPVKRILRSGDRTSDILLKEGDTVQVGESLF